MPQSTFEIRGSTVGVRRPKPEYTRTSEAAVQVLRVGLDPRQDRGENRRHVIQFACADLVQFGLSGLSRIMRVSDSAARHIVVLMHGV